MGKASADTEKMKSDIARKLFARPLPHDCYRRLSKTEKKYIEENAGLNDLDLRIFDLRCTGMSFDVIARTLGYHPRYCKAVAARVRERIACLVQ